MARVLIVDDEKSIRSTVGEFLRMDGHEVWTAEDAGAARAIMEAHTVDVVVTDIVLPRVSGVALLQQIKERDPGVQVIVMTGEPTVDTAAEAVRAGACDYLSKPIGKRELLTVVRNAAHVKALLDEARRLEAENRRYQEHLEGMVAERTAALTERTRQLAAVREVAAEISREMHLANALDLIAQRAMSLVAGLSATVFIWDEPRQCLVPKAWRGYHEWLGKMELKAGEGVMGTVVVTRQRLVVEDYGSSPYALPSLRAHTGAMGPVLAEPLLYGDTLLGVLGVDRAVGARCFDKDDQDVFALFAHHAAIAIQNARLYEASRRHAEELETRVAERTQELARANEQLHAASRNKTEFLANMSHEIRTPLNSILGFAQVLQEQGKGVLTEKQRRFLDNIYRSGQHLLRLINDILDLSKVEAGKFVLNPEPLPVAQTVEDILVIARGLAHRKSQRIDAEIAPDLPRVLADSVRFKQICFNLLSNAVKYTPDGGAIAVRVRAAARREPGAGEPGAGRAGAAPGGYLELAVTDTGVGIRADDIPLLFREFAQLETTRTQHQDGTGLGLALTKRLVELHGGRIWAESAGEGRGATFTVRLPFAGPGATPA
jgi:signal transduction histidine kinase/DNA-binding response OmpR family regulator